MSVEYWIIAISIGIVALAFLALVVFLVVTLLSLRRTIVNLDNKIHAFDPLFRIVNKTGEVIERKTNHIAQLSHEIEESAIEAERHHKDRILNTAMEVAEWTLVGVALWQKIRERK